MMEILFLKRFSVFIISIISTIILGIYGAEVFDANCLFATNFCSWSARSEGSSVEGSLKTINFVIVAGASSEKVQRYATTRATIPATTTPRPTTTKRVDNSNERNNSGRGTNSRQRRQSDDGETLGAGLYSVTLPARGTGSTRTRTVCVSFWYAVTSNSQLYLFKSIDGDVSTMEDSPQWVTSASNSDGSWRQVRLLIATNAAFKLKLTAITPVMNNGVKVAQITLRSGQCYQTGTKSDMFKPATVEGVQSRGLLEGGLWPNNVVYYTFESSFPSNDRSMVNKAMSTVSGATCIKFVARNKEEDYVLFKRLSTQQACKAPVGWLGGQHDAELGNSCMSNDGEMLHLMMHVLGFQHEHQRSDRDDFITIDFSNVADDGMDQMAIDYSSPNVGPYDYTSVTHFGPFAFAIDRSSQTITPLEDSPKTKLMGQRFGLSFADIDSIKESYGCSTGGNRNCAPACRNGGTCHGPNFCICPTGFSGQQCQIGTATTTTTTTRTTTRATTTRTVANDCKNGGTKYEDGSCECRPGFQGNKCETPICTEPCQNRGYCTGPDFCTCPTGYIGNFCQYSTATTTTPRRRSCNEDRDCGGDEGLGVCSDQTGACRCLTGYTGQYCRTPICTGGCGSNGRCTAPNRCTCDAGWEGSGCSIPICTGGCGANADCVAPNVCRCKSGWTGVGCTTPTCAVSCKNGGTCTAPNFCTCVDGWGGSSCTTVTKPTIELGERCTLSAQCLGENTHCETLTSTCTIGLCACAKGYLASNGRCVKLAKVGERCDSPDIDCVANANCGDDGTCQCDEGYKRGPLNRCAKDTASKIAGEECTSPSECYYDLICRYDSCTCPPGTISDSDYTCREIRYGDVCTSNVDCSRLDRAICGSSGKCECSTGYLLTNYLSERNVSLQTCARRQYLARGSVCPLDRSDVCESGHACIQCRGSSASPLCLRPGKPIIVEMVAVGILTGKAATAISNVALLCVLMSFARALHKLNF